jgi:hypothetical protein
VKHMCSYDDSDTQFMRFENLWDNPRDRWENEPHWLWFTWQSIMWRWYKLTNWVRGLRR